MEARGMLLSMREESHEAPGESTLASRELSNLPSASVTWRKYADHKPIFSFFFFRYLDAVWPSG